MMIDVELLSGTGGVIMIVFAALIGHLNTVRKLHGQKVKHGQKIKHGQKLSCPALSHPSPIVSVFFRSLKHTFSNNLALIPMRCDVSAKGAGRCKWCPNTVNTSKKIQLSQTNIFLSAAGYFDHPL